MRCVVQRVSRASVTVAGERVSEIGRGFMVLVGALEGDGEEVTATLLQNGVESPVTLCLPGLTREERDIILAGCLINFYAK